jgi:hypothetical protein
MLVNMSEGFPGLCIEAASKTNLTVMRVDKSTALQMVRKDQT